jgi:hypothetical protein
MPWLPESQTYIKMVIVPFEIHQYKNYQNVSVTFKMTHFTIINKGQNQYDYTRNLTLIDKCSINVILNVTDSNVIT